jgi:hypothetical protein
MMARIDPAIGRRTKAEIPRASEAGNQGVFPALRNDRVPLSPGELACFLDPRRFVGLGRHRGRGLDVKPLYLSNGLSDDRQFGGVEKTLYGH